MALIRQLLEGVVIPTTVEKQIDTLFRSGDRSPTIEEFAGLFDNISKNITKVTIVIDGLNECKQETQTIVLSMIHQIVQGYSNTKVLFTSREEDNILASLKGFPRLRISADHISNDIDGFIESTVEDYMESSKLAINQPLLKEEIVTKLKQGANGMSVRNQTYLTQSVTFTQLTILGFYGFISSSWIYATPLPI